MAASSPVLSISEGGGATDTLGTVPGPDYSHGEECLTTNCIVPLCLLPPLHSQGTFTDEHAFVLHLHCTFPLGSWRLAISFPLSLLYLGLNNHSFFCQSLYMFPSPDHHGSSTLLASAVFTVNNTQMLENTFHFIFTLLVLKTIDLIHTQKNK